MKIQWMTVAAACVLAALPVAAHRGGPGGGAGLPPKLAEFDKDGDGKLSETERAALRAAIEAKRLEFIAKYDANKDGVLDAAERAKAKADLEAQRAAERTAKFTTIDKDGNGKLTLAELGASLPDLSAERVAAVFKRFDADADGVISLAEFVDPSKPDHPGRPGGRR